MFHVDEMEYFNPEVEYQKYLRRKPVLDTSKAFEEVAKREQEPCPYNFKGYGVQNDNSTMYRTCNSEYGYYAPNSYTISTRYYPLRQHFSNDMQRFGMYRNFSLNTSKDRGFM